MIEVQILNEILSAGMFFGLVQLTCFVYGVASARYIVSSSE